MMVKKKLKILHWNICMDCFAAWQAQWTGSKCPVDAEHVGSVGFICIKALTFEDARRGVAEPFRGLVHEVKRAR